MAVTENTYTGDGVTVLFSFTFPYLDESHIKVSLNGNDTTAYTLANATTVQFNSAPAVGVTIRIYRNTDSANPTATFFPGSAIRASDLNDNFLQAVYINQETRDITVNASAGNIADGSINTAKLADTAVSTAKLGDGSVTEPKLATGAVTEAKIGSAAVTSAKIGTGAVGTTQIADDAVTSAKIAVGAVNTTEIASSAVTTDKVADNAITAAKLGGPYSQPAQAVSALDIDCSQGNYFTKTINGASTFTVSNVPASRAYSFTLELTHTSGAVTWFSGVEWPKSVAPVLTTGKTHLFMFVTDDGGTRWRGSALVDYTD